jgi:hypothetical protein
MKNVEYILISDKEVLRTKKIIWNKHGLYISIDGINVLRINNSPKCVYF